MLRHRVSVSCDQPRLCSGPADSCPVPAPRLQPTESMQFREDEASVVETAVRLAVESVMNVLCGLNSARTHELQRTVAERNREIQRLEGRVREIESELRLLRRGCTGCTRPTSQSDPQGSSEEPDSGGGPELGLLTGPPSQASPGGLELELELELDQTCSSQSSEALCVSVPVSQLPHCPGHGQVQQEPHFPGHGQVKQEPLGPDHGQVQQEPQCPGHGQVKEEPHCPGLGQVQQEPHCPGHGQVQQEPHCPGHGQVQQEPHCPGHGQVQQEPHCPGHEQVQQEPMDSLTVFLQRDMSLEVSPRAQDKMSHREPWQSVTPEAEANPFPRGELLRSRKGSVPSRELSEEAKRLKRAAWRAASRRYYARKVARQQALPSAPQYRLCSGTKRGKMPVAELPVVSQRLHREAWTVASMGLQTGPSQPAPHQHCPILSGSIQTPSVRLLKDVTYS